MKSYDLNLLICYPESKSYYIIFSIIWFDAFYRILRPKIAKERSSLVDFLSFDMIPSVKYFQLWSNTTIWDKFWKPWKEVAFLAQICQEKVDFCRHSSGTTYCFCQIFDIKMI